MMTNMNDSDDPATVDVSFSAQIQPLFNDHCIRCHVEGGEADLADIPLRLSQGLSYDQLVNQTSVQRVDLTLVVPGNSAASLLFSKVAVDALPGFDVGDRMPLRGPFLTPAQLDLIADWIDQGAQEN